MIGQTPCRILGANVLALARPTIQTPQSRQEVIVSHAWDFLFRLLFPLSHSENTTVEEMCSVGVRIWSGSHVTFFFRFLKAKLRICWVCCDCCCVLPPGTLTVIQSRSTLPRQFGVTQTPVCSGLHPHCIAYDPPSSSDSCWSVLFTREEERRERGKKEERGTKRERECLWERKGKDVGKGRSRSNVRKSRKELKLQVCFWLCACARQCVYCLLCKKCACMCVCLCAGGGVSRL